ncbi:curved DNA-binding protein [Endozoicomonas sp. SCSIO W0465]|uniref:curved DNA-binding protein n=1 Tax=Endozoicomonas sp. SCSIO W0465 TaxID=2918516 RepID=UPI0020763B31|nr:curved DNA-binding protein [Endozoicomonas sp. SCSIO W0465]USE38313.1 curved DNA-binding protein [Endozoicomonas sp. SCSIO W0465]
MEFKDYYKILGVAPDADKKTIKNAYRKLARKYHPDVSDHRDAENQFKEVAEAYEVLKDDGKRAEYDEIRQYGGAHQGFRPPPGWEPSDFRGGGGSHFQGDFSDFFSSVFGGGTEAGSSDFGRRRTYNQRGQDIETEMPVFLEDTLSEESKTISYSLPHYDEHGQVTEVNKTLKVKIPSGVTDGELIRLKGQGAPGIGDGSSGDLYLRIRLVPHPLFDVEGHNLIITLPLAPWEAALGAKVTLPTLSGKINLTIPANSQSGQRLRVKGKGLPGKQVQGDLYAVLKIVMPKSNDSIKEHWQLLAEQAPFEPRAEWSEVP